MIGEQLDELNAQGMQRVDPQQRIRDLEEAEAQLETLRSLGGTQLPALLEDWVRELDRERLALEPSLEAGKQLAWAEECIRLKAVSDAFALFLRRLATAGAEMVRVRRELALLRGVGDAAGTDIGELGG